MWVLVAYSANTELPRYSGSQLAPKRLMVQTRYRGLYCLRLAAQGVNRNDTMSSIAGPATRQDCIESA